MSEKITVKVDTENMCIDRSTELGQKFAEFNKKVAESDDPAERDFMSKISAYVEAGLIVENTLSEEDAKVAIAKLKEQMTAESK